MRGEPRRGRSAAGSTAAALVVLLGGAAPLAAQLPPDGSWRTLETPHFRVTFPEHLPDLGRRAADRAERAYAALREAFVEAPRGRIDLVVSDHVDFANGFASVFPSNRVTVYARPPVDGFELSFFDEWLELVITHELAHIFHLDLTGTPGRLLRGLMGRVPAPWPVFPGLLTPGWTIEGLATYYESFLTGSGRVHGSYHEMVVRTAVLEGAFESIDRASGQSPDWPGPTRIYIYGSLFFEHLLERHGPDRMAAFARAVAGQWIPFRLNAAARRAFGVSFSRAWRSWRDGLEEEYSALADSLAGHAPLTAPEALTTSGRLALRPRTSPDGSTLAFARSDGRSDAQIRLLEPADGGSRKLARTNGVVNFAWLPDGGVVFSQLEFADPYRIRSDLYVASPSGSVRRVTRDARLDHPAPAPDGRGAVAVQDHGGTNRLVTADLSTGEVRPLVEYRDDVHWAYPRWSPDGRWLAASRWTAGARYDVVLLRPDGSLAHEVTADRAVDIAPAWSPDGRWLLWSSDRSGIPNVYAVPVDPATGRPGALRQVTNVLGGAAYPDVDPSGRWLTFSGYHAHGWQVERIPVRPGEWFDPLPVPAHVRGGGEEAARRYGERAEAPDRPYSPLRSLLPRYWGPTWIPRQTVGRDRVEVIGPYIGAFTGGSDLVGRHSFGLWAAVEPAGGRLDGALSYRWAGLGNPILGLFLRQEHDAAGPLAGRRPDGTQDILYLEERERQAALQATLVRQRFRTTLALTVSGGVVREERTLLDGATLEPTPFFRLLRPDRTHAETRASLFASTARRRPLSVGLEEGLGVGLQGRVRSDLDVSDTLTNVAGQDRSFQELTGSARAYKALGGPGFSNHVLALRVAGGAAEGPGADRFHFDLGGASGQPEAISGFGVFGGSPLLFPVRGLPRGIRSGRYAWTATAEYRFPLALVNRGIGLVPLHLDRLSGTLFVDAGNAWGPDVWTGGVGNPRRDPVSSAGGELLVTGSPLWSGNLTVRVGVAFPLQEESGQGAQVHVRLGTSF